MLLAALLLTLFDNRGVPEDAVTVTKSKTSGQAPEYASITSSSSLPSSGVSSSSSAASSSSSPNDTSSGTPPLADTVIRVFASEWLMTMVGIAMTLLAVFLAIHMNPSDKFIMGGFALVFPEVYLLQHVVRLGIHRGYGPSFGPCMTKSKIGCTALSHANMKYRDPQFIAAGNMDWRVPLPVEPLPVENTILVNDA